MRHQYGLTEVWAHVIAGAAITVTAGTDFVVEGTVHSVHTHTHTKKKHTHTHTHIRWI